MSPSARGSVKASAVWLRRSLTLVLAAAVVSGCDDSGSKSYTAREVVDALRAHGFATAAASSDPAAFPDLLLQGRDGSAKLVAETDPLPRYAPGRGPSTGELVVAALVFHTQ